MALSLSKHENKRNKSLIAYNTTFTNPDQWDKFPEQKSAEITLQAGQKYFFEILHKEASGSDHLIRHLAESVFFYEFAQELRSKKLAYGIDERRRIVSDGLISLELGFYTAESLLKKESIVETAQEVMDRLARGEFAKGIAYVVRA